MAKILFPLEGFNNSGGLRIITLLANNLCKGGHSITILVPDYAANPYYPISEDITVKIIKTRNLPHRRIYYFFCMLIMAGRRGYSIAIATGFKTPLYIHLSKWLNFSKLKVLYIIQHYEISSQINFGNNNYTLGKYLKRLIALFGFKQESKKVAVSEWVRNKIGDQSILIIPNGIDLKIFKIQKLIEKRNPWSIGIVGSTKPIKGYDNILQAISILPKSLRSKITLNIMTLDDIELPEFVNHKLYRPSDDYAISSFYNDCNYFVFGSLEEGFGLPPLEAMACGCLVISSDCGGVRQFLNKTNSFLYPVGDSNKLAFILEKLLSKENNSCEAIRNKGITDAKDYSIDTMFLSYSNLIRDLENK